MTIEEQAHRMTVRHYLSRGYFGGKARISGGIVVGKEYFNFEKVKQEYIKELEDLKQKNVLSTAKTS